MALTQTPITSNPDHGRVREAFEESLAKLDVEYIDLYLMHWPQAVKSSAGSINSEYYFLPYGISQEELTDCVSTFVRRSLPT